MTNPLPKQIRERWSHRHSLALLLILTTVLAAGALMSRDPEGASADDRVEAESVGEPVIANLRSVPVDDARVIARPETTTTTGVPPSPVATPTPTPNPTPTPAGGSVGDIIRSIFGADGDAAVRVANCESHLNPGAVSSGGGNHGLFQINSVHSGQFESVTGQPWSARYDATANTRFAKWLFDQSGWGPWACSWAA